MMYHVRVAFARNVVRMALGRGSSLRAPSSYSGQLMFEGMPMLGLGLAALGRPGYINLNRAADLGDNENNDGPSPRSQEGMRANAFEVLDVAYARGVRYFDCAASYGLSEKFLAAWLKERKIAPGGDLVVGSKWGYVYKAGWQIEVPEGGAHEVKDHSLNNLISQACTSNNILGEHLNMLQIHSATLESGVLDDWTIVDRLVRMRTHHGWRIGLTLSGPTQASTLAKAMEVGIFDCVQATYNVMEQSAGPALVAAQQAGMEVIVKEALGNGRVLSLPPLVAMAKRLGTTPDALALAAVLAQPFQPLVLSGAVSSNQIESNANSLDLELPNDDLALLLDACRVDPADYWTERSDLQWN